MARKILIIALAVLAAALVTVTVAYAAYPNGTMYQQGNSTHQMTEEQCETQMQNVHGSGSNGLMMGNYDHDAMHNGMMNYNDTASAPSGMMGRGGCH